MIEIDVRSRTPIYKQIYEQIETLALNGILAPNERIASVRQLAKQLGINPNTITKAYAELEQNGIICSVSGRGSFISPNLSAAGVQKRNDTLQLIKKDTALAVSLGIPREDVLKAVSEVYDESSEVTK